MIPLTRIWPAPVACMAGDRLIMVSQITLRDLATLQTLVEVQHPHPIDVAIAEAGEDWNEVRRILGRDPDAVIEYPPCYGDKRAAEHTETLGGLAVLLHRAMERAGETLGKESLDLDDVLDLCKVITIPQWMRIQRIIWGTPAWAEGQGLLAPKTNDPDEPEAVDWAEEVKQLCETFSYTPDQVGELYMSQWRILRAGGKADAYRPVVPYGMSFEEIGEYNRRLWRGELEADGTPSGELGSTTLGVGDVEDTLGAV